MWQVVCCMGPAPGQLTSAAQCVQAGVRSKQCGPGAKSWKWIPSSPEQKASSQVHIRHDFLRLSSKAEVLLRSLTAAPVQPVLTPGAPEPGLGKVARGFSRKFILGCMQPPGE